MFSTFNTIDLLSHSLQLLFCVLLSLWSIKGSSKDRNFIIPLFVSSILAATSFVTPLRPLIFEPLGKQLEIVGQFSSGGLFTMAISYYKYSPAQLI